MHYFNGGSLQPGRLSEPYCEGHWYFTTCKSDIYAYLTCFFGAALLFHVSIAIVSIMMSPLKTHDFEGDTYAAV